MQYCITVITVFLHSILPFKLLVLALKLLGILFEWCNAVCISLQADSIERFLNLLETRMIAVGDLLFI